MVHGTVGSRQHCSDHRSHQPACWGAHTPKAKTLTDLPKEGSPFILPQHSMWAEWAKKGRSNSWAPLIYPLCQGKAHTTFTHTTFPPPPPAAIMGVEQALLCPLCLSQETLRKMRGAAEAASFCQPPPLHFPMQIWQVSPHCCYERSNLLN